MSAPHPHRATIEPVPATVARPRWSVMIPTYDCAPYLRRTLASVLAQDPGPEQMQIEVVDDCSHDDPEAIVHEIGQGRVSFHRQPQNVGHVRNFNSCLQRARGELVHLLHGDDMVRHGFYRAIEAAFARDRQIGAAFCRYIGMDEDDHWTFLSPLLQRSDGVIANWLESIATVQSLQVASMVVRRESYERVGGFDDRILSYGEDWEMWVRLARHFPVAYVTEPLALYRGHDESLSGRSARDGQARRDILRVLELNREHLPPDRAEHVTRAAAREWAHGLLRRRGYRLAVDASFPAAAIGNAWAFDHSPITLLRAARLVVRWLLTLAGPLVGQPPRR